MRQMIDKCSLIFIPFMFGVIYLVLLAVGWLLIQYSTTITLVRMIPPLRIYFGLCHGGL